MAARRDVRLGTWRSYFETSIRLQTALDAQLRRDAEMTTMEYHLLLLLVDAPGCRLRMGELSSSMAFSSSRLTYQIGAMERRGWVAREPALEDGRGSYAVLTDAGRDAFTAAGPRHLATIRSLFLDELSPQEAEVLDTVFGRLAERLRNT